jgi:hypothetical protein
VIGLVLCGLAVGACSGDDGGDVRTTGDGGSGSGSASGSGSGSGSASGVASGSGSGSASGIAPECEAFGDAATAATEIAVTLTEFDITLSEDTAPAGIVHFALTNTGAEPHEFVVVQGVAPADLPLDDDGALDEAALPDGALVGEVEPFPGEGATCDGTFELGAGDYTLLCNIVETEEDGAVESHLAENMVATFTVT